MQVTVGSKYQIVIPKDVRNKIKGIKPGNKVSVKTDKDLIIVKPASKNWADENYGKYKKYLKGAAEEVEKMRDEWEDKVKESERDFKLK